MAKETSKPARASQSDRGAEPTEEKESDGGDKPEHLDRMWSANAPGQGKQAGNLVSTQWWVDYQSVAGKTKRLPDRYGDDQLVVDQLKIHPSGATSSKILRGGNMAKSGQAFLGAVHVPKGPGQVSATVRYAKKSAFRIEVRLSPAATGAELATLNKARSDAKARVLERVEDRGDYAAIAAEVQQELAERFPNKTLVVEVHPVGKAAPKQYVADAAEYEANGDSKFVAVIDPTGQQDESVTTTHTAGDESHIDIEAGSGTKATSETTTRDKESHRRKIIHGFTASMTSGVKRLFQTAVEGLTNKSDVNGKDHEATVTWNAGIGPSQADKAAQPGDKSRAKPPESPGFFKRVKDAVFRKGRWLLSKGKGAVKALPIVGAALDLAGDLWGTITGRGTLSRESTTTNGTSESHTTGESTKAGTLLSVSEEIANVMTKAWTEENETALENEVSTKLGLEVTQTGKVGTGTKSTGSTTTSRTTVTHDVGKPRVTLKKL